MCFTTNWFQLNGYCNSSLMLFSKITYYLNRLQSSFEIDVIVVKKTYLFKFCWKVCNLCVYVTTIIEYVWICLNKQGSEFSLGPRYAKILNMAKFWIWQGSQYVSVTQDSEYARISLGKVLNISQILNMAGFLICKSYSRF